MAELKSLRSLTLDLPPSCIQFCPTKPRLFVVGTYFLHRNDLQGYESAQPDDTVDALSTESAEVSQASQKRTGSLILYELSQDNNITELCTTATDFAILDIQWTLHPDKLGNLLAVATSTGLLAFYRLQESSDIAQQPQLVLSCIKQITDDKTLVLSLTWHPHRPHVLAVTLSDGRVCLCTSSSTTSGNDDAVGCWSQNAVISMQDAHEHELEAWIVSFMPETAKVLSGGDDMILQCSHITEELEGQYERLWQDRKLHEAGVTAILPLSDSLAVTGSYDDHIRLLSLPAIGRRKVLAELNLGGAERPYRW
ncbi:Putative WD40/YVTN repeat-like-containing domain superfamily [Septoria linicola]|uniref:WD40/YVTN repeat-like-containing domain superfamily n=1 Tax=Septoria linicola TaxID=215465 RepID=A0A9Q9B1Y6_9PEZI|nr:Putative WD40/YVTN repeat-like-containing domain superfamily [Septoria linicola]